MRTAVQNDIPSALAFIQETIRIWREDAWVGPFFVRGQRENRSLLPSLYRRISRLDAMQAERDLVQAFRRRAPAFHSFLPESGLEWLSLMQHHGLETRLLDWTDNLLVGLYFALRDADGDSTPTLYVLNAEALNTHSFGGGDADPWEDQALEDYALPERAPDDPAALLLPHSHGRIAAQRGAFTVHGRSHAPLSSYGTNDILASVSFNAKEATACRRQLFDMGVSDTLFFPDLDHLSKEISREAFELGA